PRGRAVDEYIAGRGATSYDQVREQGFSHGFGASEANRELVEWMREYNAQSSHPVKLNFYGFDSPTEMMGADSPRRLLSFVLEFFASIDAATAHERRERIEGLIGSDAVWENTAAAFDPTKAVG